MSLKRTTSSDEEDVIPMPKHTKLLQVSMLTNNEASGNGKALCDFKGDLKNLNDCKDLERFTTLKEDFEKLTKMTLLDDKDIMDELYLQSPGFITVEFLRAAAAFMYREKYSEYFEKYPSLEGWLECILWYMVNYSETSLKGVVQRVIRHPRADVVSGEFFKKRMLFKRGETIAQNDSLAKHPLLKTTAVTTKDKIFSIGKCLEYIVPSEFAILFMSACKGNINKYGLGQTTAYEGIRVSFNRAILVTISYREVKGIGFTDFTDMGDVRTTLEKMTGLRMMGDAFSFGKKKTLKSINLKTKSSGSNINFSDDGYFLAPISSMSCISTADQHMEIRSFSDNVFYFDNVSIEQSVLDAASSLSESKREELEAELAKFN